MAYLSKAEKLRHSSYRFTHKITATESKRVDYPNGMTGTEQVETWSRPSALYSTNMTRIASIEIYNAKYDIQFAVRKIANDPFDDFNFNTAIVLHVDSDDKTKYTVKNIQRSVMPNGYHILTLTTNADSSSSSSSSSGSGGYY